MQSERIDEMLLVRYLLGDVSEEEQVAVEDRAFSDVAYRGALEAAEADLIDAWVRGDLDKAQRRAFAQRFLNSASRRRKVDFAQDLARVAAELNAVPAAKPPLWRVLANLMAGGNPAIRLASSIAAVLCVAGAVWLAVENTRIRSSLGMLESGQTALLRQLSDEQRRAAALADQLRRPSPAIMQPPAIASLILLPGVSRSQTAVQQLPLQAGAQIVHIEIPLDFRDNYQSFRADLRTRGGQEILTVGNLSRQKNTAGSVVSFDVPVSILHAGGYELALKGIGRGESAQDIGFYYFNVLNR